MMEIIEHHDKHADAATNENNLVIKLNCTPKGFGDTPDELTADMFASALPVQHSYDYYVDEARGIYIGVWDTTDMEETPGPYHCDEFMVLLEGAARIKNNRSDKCETILAGESFVIPQGYDCQWQQQGYLRKFYVIAEHPEQSMPATAVHEGVVTFKAANNGIQYQHQGFTSGIYQGDTLALLAEPMTSSKLQFFYLNRGKLTLTLLTPINGQMMPTPEQAIEFKAGEAFIIPQAMVYQMATSAESIIHYVEV